MNDKFSAEKRKLLKLKEQFFRANLEKREHVVAEINLILNSMLNAGLELPLDQRFLIDLFSLSEQYVAFVLSYMNEHPVTFLDFLKQHHYVCVATQLSKITSTTRFIEIEVEENLRVGFWHRLMRKRYRAAPMNQMPDDPYSQAGQRAVFVLDKQLRFWDGMGRMPILSTNGSDEAVFWGNNYLCCPLSPMEKFWPTTVPVKEVNVPLRKHWLVPLEQVKCLVKSA